MKLLRSDKLLDHVSDIIYEDTQLQDNHIDLTVTEIHQFSEAGALDFGGSEFRPARTEPIKPKKQNTDDDYGWWELEEGTYQAVFNESVEHPENSAVFIAPHIHAVESGIMISSQILSPNHDLDRITLNFKISKIGCNIKENARFASLYIMSS